MSTAFDLRYEWRREWRDVAEQFKALPDPPDPRLFLCAIHRGGGHWALAGGSADKTERDHLQSEFRFTRRHMRGRWVPRERPGLLAHLLVGPTQGPLIYSRKS
jgi:hypothetical protein